MLSLASKLTMRGSYYAILALAVTSGVWARDSSIAPKGRSLLSHGNDTDSGMLVTYWGQNSAAPTYQEPDLDQVRSCEKLFCASLHKIRCLVNR